MKFQDKGVSKETLAMLAVLYTPVALMLPAVISKYTSSPRPLGPFLKALPVRIGMNLVFSAIMTCMYPPPHMTCMYPPPHMTCLEQVRIGMNLVFSAIIFAMPLPTNTNKAQYGEGGGGAVDGNVGFDLGFLFHVSSCSEYLLRGSGERGGGGDGGVGGAWFASDYARTHK